MPDKLRTMYKRLGIAMLGIATAATIGACSPAHEQPSDQSPEAEQHPTALKNAPDPVTLGDDSTGNTDSSEGSSAKSKDCTAGDVEVDGSYGSEPTVTVPQDCDAPTSLQKQDVKQGSGAEADDGSDIDIHYQVVAWSDGDVVDSNFDSGDTRTVQDLGDADVIEGLNEGLVGMKEDGRRVLIVPPGQGYGSEGKDSIGGDETLVFIIDAVSVQS